MDRHGHHAGNHRRLHRRRDGREPRSPRISPASRTARSAADLTLSSPVRGRPHRRGHLLDRFPRQYTRLPGLIRVRPPDCPAAALPIFSFYAQTPRSTRRAHPCFAENRPRQPLLSNLINPNPVAKSRSATGTAGAPLPAISCLGAFRTPAAGARGWLIIPGIRKPAQFQTHALRQAASLFDHHVGAQQHRL